MTTYNPLTCKGPVIILQLLDVATVLLAVLRDAVVSVPPPILFSKPPPHHAIAFGGAKFAAFGWANCRKSVPQDHRRDLARQLRSHSMQALGPVTFEAAVRA